MFVRPQRSALRGTGPSTPAAHRGRGPRGLCTSTHLRHSLLAGLFVGLLSLGVACDGWVLPTDTDGDGYPIEAGDCDNNDPLTYPGAPELCDGKDNNCDGLGDTDTDGDGHLACDSCPPGVRCGDCDDGDGQIHPGAPERCNGIDDNCDGQGDVDSDKDGSCRPEDCDDHNPSVSPHAPELCNGRDDNCDGQPEQADGDADGDGWPVCGISGDDCDDSDPKVHPFAPETCNGRDDDCDGKADDPPGAFDHDADGTSDCVDNDLDGYTEQGGDCDDLSRYTSPAGEEFADGQDNDCDGLVDETLADADLDSDGFSASTGDCDDENPAVHPGVSELCDGTDQDCDSRTDEGVLTSFWRDSDADTWGAGSATRSCQRPSGAWATQAGDCDDKRQDVHPTAPELCNGIDDNCDGQADEWPDQALTWYRDDDGDGWGEAQHSVQSGCLAPEGYAALKGDCDDSSAEAYPGHDEWCSDSLDNDCDGDIDEVAAALLKTRQPEPETAKENPMQWRIAIAAAMLTSAPLMMGNDGCCETQTYYYDTDGDGFGNPYDAVQSCDPPTGYVDNAEDCDDRDTYTYPGAEERCDGKDNNCDGVIDEDCKDGQALCERTEGEWTLGCAPVTCENPQGDELISCFVAIELCRCPDSAPYWDDTQGCISVEQCDVQVDQDGDGVSIQRGDCDDEDATIYPGATERCDGLDNDCDGVVDEDCPGDQRLCEASGGAWNECGSACGPVSCPGEPITTAPCIDECKAQCDCPADAPFWLEGEGCVREDTCPDTTDADRDGWTVARGDCDDNNPRVNPGAPEVCDGIDNNCNGRIDENGGRTYYLDEDGDGYGNDASAQSTCGEPPPIYVGVGGDCNDHDPSINPGVRELCDGVDNNCDGVVDETCDCFFGDDGTYWCPCDASNVRMDPAVPIFMCECDPATGQCPAPWNTCEATGGRWNECGSGCGPETCDDPSPGPDCPAVCVPQCECPADAPFWDDNLGCISRDVCGTGEEDKDADGFTVRGGDCDDSNPAINPRAEEVCDGLDNNCDGMVDEGCNQPRICEVSGGSWTDCGSGCGPATCDNPAPGDICPAVCVPQCECPEDAPFWDESDGCVPREQCAATGDDRDGDGFSVAAGDCDDSDPTVNPRGTEVCDGIDNDCDGVVDEGCDATRLCQASGGDWGEGCGQATCDDPNAPILTTCVTTSPMCLCPESAPFWDAAKGCIAPTDCRTGDPRLCQATGGTFEQGCQPTTCGNVDIPFAGDCFDGYYICSCGPDAPLWDDTKGCVTEDTCGAP